MSDKSITLRSPQEPRGNQGPEGASPAHSTAGGAGGRPTRRHLGRGGGEGAACPEGRGVRTCRRLGRSLRLPPGPRPGRWTGPWASGPESHTPGPTGGRRGAELRRWGSPGRGGGGLGEGPGRGVGSLMPPRAVGRAPGDRKVATPRLRPSLAPTAPGKGPALSGLLCPPSRFPLVLYGEAPSPGRGATLPRPGLPRPLAGHPGSLMTRP